MRVEALIETCAQLGIKLELAGDNNDRLKVDAPKGAMTAELREALTSNKPELIAFLNTQHQATQEPDIETEVPQRLHLADDDTCPGHSHPSCIGDQTFDRRITLFRNVRADGKLRR